VSPSPNPSVAAAAAPLPPLPDLNTQPNSQPQTGDKDILSSLMSGIGPVKSSVDAINQACRAIVKSGVIPGGEQICGQIVALATSLLPMAAQNLLQPSGAGGPGASQGPGAMSMLPPPGGPVPMPQ
jgi:hypothetical protein